MKTNETTPRLQERPTLCARPLRLPVAASSATVPPITQRPVYLEGRGGVHVKTRAKANVSEMGNFALSRIPLEF